MTLAEEKAAELARRIAGCRVCAAHLPHGVRPVTSFSPSAKLLIIGQAPGSKVHLSGIPWDDKSGDRLREWTGLDRDTMYDPTQVALCRWGSAIPERRAAGTSRPAANALLCGTTRCYRYCPRIA